FCMSTTSTAVRAGSIDSDSGRAGIDNVRLIRKTSQRVFADDFPAIVLAELFAFVVAHRVQGPPQELFDVAAGGGRGIEKKDAAGFGARALPGMRDVARGARARAAPAPGNLLADPHP